MAQLNSRFTSRGFGDESVTSGGGMTPRYKAIEHRKDRMRILPVKGVEVPIIIGMHKTMGPKGIAWLACTMGDDCPACIQGYEAPVDRWVVPIVLLSTRTLNKGAKKSVDADVNEIQRWVFGRDKYTQIRDIILPEFDDPKELFRTDLEVVCQEQQFQRVAISVVPGKSTLTRETAGEWKGSEMDKFIEWMNDEHSVDGVNKSIARLSGGSRQRTSSPRGTSRPAPVPAAAEPDNFDADLDDLVDGL